MVMKVEIGASDKAGKASVAGGEGGGGAVQ